ncbi:DUF58 domain-containing protein [Coraliomargarita parva]|uniref:DUF58 domain-containing protein n=1 Tax=Coraliomargarita parva TaxID=3014050 RepID=UPI0022B320D9|nr:DUF58 domain-containing protein [Coraliomargarita parva]
MMRPVPSQRCLYLVAVLLPLSLLSAAFGTGGSLLYLVAGGILLISLLDLLLSASRMKGLAVTLDPVTRLSRENPGRITVHIRVDGQPPEFLTVGLPLPVSFLQDDAVRRVKLVDSPSNHWTLDFPVTARLRGVFACPAAYVQLRSVLGLFDVRRVYRSEAEIRVYPNLRRERRQLANLFLNRGLLGIHSQRMVGQGREYEQLREYATGDSIQDIHWKASAKRGELVTKTYQVERTQEIYFVIDHSRLSGLRTTRSETDTDDDYAETLLERYVTAASVLGLVAEQAGDLFGLVAFGSQVSRFVRASSGKQHHQVIQDALFDLKSEPGPFDLDELFSFLRMRLRRRALLIFMTDLNDHAAGEDFGRHVGMIAGQHHVLVNSIRREGVWPMYQNPDAPDLVGELAGHLRWDGLRELQAELRAAGVEFAVLDDEKLSLDLVNQYLSVKQRQIL